ncbi:dihydrolipoyl dehydrogenase family protein [Halocynthiibacter namhaensis]|uniref:dihydrolipoyl dehydrogenase family protein n=1 Tax=Halocynthiibacter namhaensis TaxID=1290553 RepID=UPI000579934E|nr:FAD-dependent oxidoreductase [Halocynthiibacter namhaensis]
MKRIKTDLCIIGAGSGGLSVAAGAVQMGADVVLIEGHKMGGDCLNYGCVPSKALIAAGKAAHAMEAGDPFGVTAAAPKIDFNRAKAHVADVVKTIEPHDSVERFEGLGVNVIQEYGRFISPTEIQAGDTIIAARRFVIATGSSPLLPPIPGLDTVPYDTNETIFEQTKRPDHLLIIGGGPIGMEMAQAHRRLGCQVTVIEGGKALGKDDPEMAEIVLRNLKSEGIEIAEDALASEIRGAAGAIEVKTHDGRVFKGTHLLMAVGRKSNIERLDLEIAEIEVENNLIKVDAGLRTSNRKVYAIGDVASPLQFTHVAGYHAGIVIRSALTAMPAKARTYHIPWATYTDPELAQVGLTEAEAREKYGAKLEVLRFDFSGNDRLIADGKARGLIKVMVVKGKPVGASIAGPQAGELINTWALVIANGLKIGAVAAMVAPYPTVSEINKRVAGVYYSPRLFESNTVKRVVRAVQKWLP